jgi:hypothetical protein
MESKDVGGCDPVEVNGRLIALRSNPEKGGTVDASELTESGREGDGLRPTYRQQSYDIQGH